MSSSGKASGGGGFFTQKKILVQARLRDASRRRRSPEADLTLARGSMRVRDHDADGQDDEASLVEDGLMGTRGTEH